jgi:hypothetical protein
MEQLTEPLTNKPQLFYAARCGKCRVLSQLVVWAAFQQIDRTPIDAEIATEFYQQHPEAKGKLVLFHAGFQAGKLVIGPWVYPLIPLTILRAWIAIARSKLNTLGLYDRTI